MEDKKKVWFVTGASKGLGNALVKELLKEGFCVAATSRTVNSLTAAFGEKSDVFLPLTMDLSDEEDIKACIRQTVEHFGTIDVAVNNAGYGQYGCIEEVSDREVRQDFEINVFGLLSVIRNVLPYMRQQKSGHIINVSSKGGFHAGAGTGIYCSTKYAVEGLSEALYFEMKPFNIHVTAVKPGWFKTDFFSSLKQTSNPMDAYQAFRQNPEEKQRVNTGHGPGDPAHAARVMIEASKAQNPPLHLFLGNDAYNSIQKKFREVSADADVWHDLAVATAYEE